MNIKQDPVYDGMRSALELFPEEMATLQSGRESYNALLGRGDCFQQAVTELGMKCSRERMNENDKIKTAISFTLCEIATGNLSIPMACIDGNQAECAGALAEMPQLWTSYSGYFRDTAYMCFATRFPIERDLLLEAQSKVLKAQASSYDGLRAHLMNITLWRQQEMDTLTNLQQLQGQLERGAYALQESLSINQAKVQHMDASVSMLEETLQQLNTNQQEHSEQLLSIVTQIWKHAMAAKEAIGDQFANAVARHQNDLDSMQGQMSMLSDAIRSSTNLTHNHTILSNQLTRNLHRLHQQMMDWQDLNEMALAEATHRLNMSQDVCRVAKDYMEGFQQGRSTTAFAFALGWISGVVTVRWLKGLADSL